MQLEVVREKHRLLVTPMLLLDKEIFIEPLTMLIEGAGIKKIRVRQGGKELPVRLSADKAMFDFDPFGGQITVKIK